ncbi:MAG TPA: Gfo/Idh/MocA family oxidoreductase, partial [Dokdonella sp.]|nr:Gfo/Idh/MocA family oxidoreductase [Dokdonella sp.]
MNRREFLMTSASAGVLLAFGGSAFGKSRERLRVGLIGTGLRGQVHLDELLKRDDVNVTAICDIEKFMLDTALKQFEKAGKRKPRIYTGSDEAWREMIAKARLDAVIIATPWEWHAPQAIAAMKAKVAVGCEVVAGITLEDHWQVLRVQQETGTPYMLLENVCYRRDVLATLNMVRQGLFGELVHLEGGYEHDLRAVKLNSGVPGKPYGGGVEFGD